jgi:hypothetical protein
VRREKSKEGGATFRAFVPQPLLLVCPPPTVARPSEAGDVAPYPPVRGGSCGRKRKNAKFSGRADPSVCFA